MFSRYGNSQFVPVFIYPYHNIKSVFTVYIQCLNYLGGGGDFPSTTYRSPWHYNSSTYGIPPLKMGWALKTFPISVHIPPSTFLLIIALYLSIFLIKLSQTGSLPSLCSSPHPHHIILPVIKMLLQYFV